jgi:hypothetical protein
MQLGFSFHGAHKEKWHSIIQQGVLMLSNTKHMSTGAAYGRGIYTSTNLATALQYAGHGAGTASMHGGLVAVVEYMSSDGGQTDFLQCTNPHIVVKEAQAVALKFLLVATKVEQPETMP